jgi:hypothetical protein
MSKKRKIITLTRSEAQERLGMLIEFVNDCQDFDENELAWVLGELELFQEAFKD